jgi:hypothetical protein
MSNKLYLLIIYFLFLSLSLSSMNLITVSADQTAFPSPIPKLRNNMLRFYVYIYPLKKKIVKQADIMYKKTTNKAYSYIMEWNSQYYSLSEEDRIIIETVFSLMY